MSGRSHIPKFLVLSLLLAATLYVALKFHRSRSTRQDLAAVQVQSVPGQLNPEKIEAHEQGNARESPIATKQVDYLVSHDPKRERRIKDKINIALASGDDGEVLRALHLSAYSREYKNSEIQSAFRSFLTNTRPYIRLLVARYLYITGDNSGRQTLLNIISLPSAILVEGLDHRIEAAEILSRYRDKGASNDIISLYGVTKDGAVLDSLARLGVRCPEEAKFSYIGSENALTHYGMVGAIEFVPKMRKTFATASDSRSRIGAARSIAQLTGEAQYLEFLAVHANIAVKEDNPNKDSLRALKYLGSIDSPIALKVLSDGVLSANKEAVKYSAVNLLHNQDKGFGPVKQLLLKELEPKNAKLFKLPEELKWQLITVASDDPEIERAAKAYSDRMQAFDWEYYVRERKQWPIYNWVDNFVVTVNYEKPTR